MRWRFRGGVFLAVTCLFAGVLAANPATADEHFARAAQLAGNGKVEQAEQEYQANRHATCLPTEELAERMPTAKQQVS